MRTLLHQTSDRTRLVPWKNGRGSTRELALWPPTARFEGGDFDWRISTAAVEEDGPFSCFPDHQRILVLTEGSALLLHHGEKAPARRLGPLEPYRFSGAWTTTAELPAGPIRDFNVLWRPEVTAAEVRPLAIPGSGLRVTLHGTHAYLQVLARAVLARSAGEGGPRRVAAGEGLWIQHPDPGEVLELSVEDPPGSALLATFAASPRRDLP